MEERYGRQTCNTDWWFTERRDLASARPLTGEILHNATYALVDTYWLDGILIYAGSLGNFVEADVLERIIMPRRNTDSSCFTSV